jgi:hypothetical protein
VRRQDRYYGRQEDDQKEVLRCRAQEQIVEEGSNDSHDGAYHDQERPATSTLADRTCRHIATGEHDVGDDKRDSDVSIGQSNRIAEQTGEDGRDRVERQPEAGHHHEDLQEVLQVVAAKQPFEGALLPSDCSKSSDSPTERTK